MTNPMTRRIFLAAVAGTPLARAGFWEKKKFPYWNQDEVDKMLTDSPWAKSMRVAFSLQDPRGHRALSFSDVGLPGGIGFPGPGLGIPGAGWPGGGQRSPGGGADFPGGGTGDRGGRRGTSVRAEAYLTVRWSSALPIKQAALLDRHGSVEKTPAAAVERLGREETHYIIEVFGLPAQVVHMEEGRLETELLESASLIRNSKRPIAAEVVEAPPHGGYRWFTFRFPRTDSITVEDHEVEFYAGAGPFEFNKKFRLKPMVYDGALAL